MNIFNIIPKAPQVRLKKENTTAIRHTLCYAAVLLGIVALLLGCPDSTGDGNGDSNGDNNGDAIGTPTEDTRVQSAPVSAVTTDAITLNWTAPTDTDGYLGVTISEENNAGSLMDAVELAAETTTHTVTDLAASTEYTFTIATRYTDSGKNNTTMVTATTAASTGVQSVALVDGTATSDSVTVTWEDPEDTDGYTGVTISVASNIGNFTATETVPNADTDTVTISGLAAAANHTLTLSFTTQYDTEGKGSSSDHTIAVSTQSNTIDTDTVMTSAVTSDSVTIAWADPEDAAEYAQVAINAAATAGSFTADATVPAADPNTLTISGLTADTAQTLTLTFVTAYNDPKQGGSSVHTTDITTQANYITAIVPSAITMTSMDLNWADPEDRVGYAGVTISASPAEGDLSSAMEIDATAGSTNEQFSVTGLTVGATYEFTIATRYDGGKAGADAPSIMVSAEPAIDADNDNLIDITSLERLDNMRYNLDLADGHYKRSGVDTGIQCGTAGNSNCIGYELLQDLDFRIADSYQSGIVNANWRPQNSSGAVLTQPNADGAANAGWDPIGSCNGDTADVGSASCGDADDTPFAARFEGNGYTIHNLYARNTTSNNASAVGLFGITTAAATIRSLGVQDGALYGGRIADSVGSIVGENGGTIVGSYASGGSVIGGNANNIIGGLVGRSSGTIIASYATVAVSTTSNVARSDIGGLLGAGLTSSTVIASYASGPVNGSSRGNAENIGGLVGSIEDNVVASYASGAVNGGDGGNLDFVGGLIGNGLRTITASYATGSVDGGNSSSFAGALRGLGGASVTNFSYGFGTVTNNGSGGNDGTAKPTVDGMVGSATITMARQLTLTNAGAIWNDAANDTLNAWDFGDSSQPPALRYADYDGTGTDYGCIDASNPTSTGTIVIPAVVAAPGGPLTITCGDTLLPGQRP